MMRRADADKPLIKILMIDLSRSTVASGTSHGRLSTLESRRRHLLFHTKYQHSENTMMLLGGVSPYLRQTAEEKTLDDSKISSLNQSRLLLSGQFLQSTIGLYS